MAQELLTLVQSNPDIHGPKGIYEAYRRMYAALGIDNVETLLQPPQDPQPPMPVEAGLENAGLLMGAPAQAFEQQDHQSHINAHRALFMTEIVKSTPPMQGAIIAHMMQHVQFMADQMAREQMPPELMEQEAQLQQMTAEGQQLPPEQIEAFMMQMQQVQLSISAPLLAEMTAALLESLGQDSSEDPLVEIRKRELDLREKQIEIDNQQFGQRQAQKAQEQAAQNELDGRRIDTSKEVADDKLDIAIARLDQQANLKLIDLQSKRGQ